MSLRVKVVDELAESQLSEDERVHLRCRISRELAESGDYEAARAAMRETWSRVGDRPALDRLNEATAAEALWSSGVLTSCIGSARQIEGAQETAKNLISESLSIFERLGESRKLVEAQTDLAVCYVRAGALDEARLLMQDALARLSDEDLELKAVVLLRSAVVERAATRFDDALRFHNLNAPLVEAHGSDALKGKFHGELAFVLRNLGASEHREEFTDRALVEYAAASYHFEQAGHTRYCARVENNLGFLFFTIGKFREAHEHLHRARRLFVGLQDAGSVAQVDDTRARALLAEGRDAEAERIAGDAVGTLEKGDEHSQLVEALTTHGTALARTGRHDAARLTLERAIEVGEQAGDLDRAGQAALALLEELCERLEPRELSATYERAADLLANSQQPDIHSRLNVCARRIIRRLSERSVIPVPAQNIVAESVGVEESSVEESSVEESVGDDINDGDTGDASFTWQGFSLRDEIRRYEKSFIERALRDAGGSITRASQLLGFKHHHNLSNLLNNRHASLLHVRKPAVPRKRSIIRFTATRQRAGKAMPAPKTQPATIFYVEDDVLVLQIMRELLEEAGWRVAACTNGSEALRRLESGERFDLIITDENLPGMKGTDLVRRARQLCGNTPVIVFSASDCETDAHLAGASAFLRKPEDTSTLVATVERLLTA